MADAISGGIPGEMEVGGGWRGGEDRTVNRSVTFRDARSTDAACVSTCITVLTVMPAGYRVDAAVDKHVYEPGEVGRSQRRDKPNFPRRARESGSEWRAMGRRSAAS